jgi:hypothetical protein
MAKIRPLLASKEVTLIAIGNGNVRMANAFVEELKFEGELFTDPELHSYKALNFKKASGLGILFSAGMWKKAFAAFKKGFRQVKTQGEGNQLGGVLVVEPEDHVLYTHAESFPGDHAPVESLLKAVGFDKETIKEELKIIFPNNEHKEKKTPRDESEA